MTDILIYSKILFICNYEQHKWYREQTKYSGIPLSFRKYLDMGCDALEFNGWPLIPKQHIYNLDKDILDEKMIIDLSYLGNDTEKWSKVAYGVYDNSL